MLCLAVFAVAGSARAQTGLLEEPAALPALNGASRTVEDHLIVRFRRDADASDRLAAREAVGADFLDSLGNRTQLVEVESDLDRAEGRLEARDDVLYAEPDFLYEKAAMPNDTFSSLLWGFNNTGQNVNGTVGTADADIDAAEAWDERTDSSSATVAVVDSGITRNHSDLASEIWSNPGETAANGIDDDGNGRVDDTWGWDFLANDKEPVDEDRHGTHVAGTIGARGNDGSGVAGVAWKSNLMALRVCDDLCPNSAIVAAFNYAPGEGARVVNASLGGASYSQALSDAITSHPDTLYVVSAGNGGTDGIGDNNETAPQYPCNYPAVNLICVGATDQFDQPASFSNYGTTSVDISAPGVTIASSAPEAPTKLALDNFEAADFATKWSANGFSRTSEVAPSVSGFHATDSPGANYAPNASATLESQPFDTIGAVDCKLRYSTSFGLGTGDVLFVEAQEGSSGWSEIGRHTGTGSGSAAVRLGAATAFEDKSSVRVRYRLAADGATQGDGFHVDNVTVGCVSTTASAWLYMAGTSMASPQVAGSAALIFSKSAAATPRSVRHALLSAGDVKSSLATKNATGRRLNLKGALDALDVVPPDTSITSAPPEAASRSASFEFTGTEDGPGSGFECKLDAGDWATCVSPKSLTGLSDGSHTFSVRATDAAGNADPSEATRTWTVTSAAADTAAPQLVEFDFTPKSVDVATGSQTVTLTMRITDNDSGAKAPAFLFDSRDTTQTAGFGQTTGISGTANDGIYQRTVTIPQGAAPGTWDAVLYPLEDNAGNSNGSFGPPAGFPKELTVTSAAADASDACPAVAGTQANGCPPVSGGGDPSVGGGGDPAVDEPSINGPGSAGATKVSLRGALTVPKQSVDCAGPGPDCTVKTRVTAAGRAGASAKRVKLGGSAFKVQSGKKGKVTVRLTRKGLKLLKRARKIKAKVTITVTRGGLSAKETVTVSLRAPKQRR